MKNFPSSLAKFLAVCSFLLPAFLATTRAAAAETKLEIQLVWGTNDDAADTQYKALEPALAKKLGMFKWKKFFMVNRKEMAVGSADAQKIRLSSRCEIEVKPVEGQRYQINVYGDGKHVRKITEKITRQDSLTIAGDDKNDCGWFILIREI